METINTEPQEAVTVREGIPNHCRRTNLEVEQTPKRETHPRKHGLSWASAEKIDGIINPKQHVDWVMMTYYGFSLEYLINFVHNLCDQGCDRNKAVEAVMAQFCLDEQYADLVSDSVFGDLFYVLIAEIHGWISDYEPEEDDGWSSSKPGMHDHLVRSVMEEFAFGKMNEVNPNP